MVELNGDESTDYSAHGGIEEDDEAYYWECPTCGDEAEGHLTCPTCGARITKSISLSIINKLAIATIVVGLLFLGVASFITAPAEFEIGTIMEIHREEIMDRIDLEDPTRVLNDAYRRVRRHILYPGQVDYQEPDEGSGEFSISVEPTRIVGRVAEVELQEADDHFMLRITDGEDNIRVRGFNALSDFQEELGERFPPNLFDRVEIIGSLDLDSQWGAQMYLSLPQRFRVIEPFEDQRREIAAISAADIGEYYWVSGTINEVSRPGQLRVIELEDRGVRIEMAVPDFIFDDLPPTEQNLLTTPGTTVDILTQVGEFRGNPQLELANPDDPDTIREVQ